MWNMVLGKPPESGSARLGHIPSLPGNRNCPWNLIPHYNLFILKGNCDSSDLLLDVCFLLWYSLICSANVGCSPTPRQHFWKTAAPKNFSVACGSYFTATFVYFQCTKKPLPNRSDNGFLSGFLQWCKRLTSSNLLPLPVYLLQSAILHWSESPKLLPWNPV